MLSGGLEDNVLCSLAWSDTLAPQIALYIKSSDFSTAVYRQIAEAALDFLQRHSRPARTHLADILEVDIKRGPDGRFMQQVVTEMEVLAPQLNEAYVLAELERFVAIQRLVNAVNTASDLLNGGDLEQAREILRAPDLLPRDNPGVWLRNIDDWLAFLREDEDLGSFSSGIDALDARGVSPARGELFVLLAAAGMGKSWFLINAGKHNLLENRKNVLHITLENSLDITLQRYTQCFLGLTRSDSQLIHVSMFRQAEGEVTAARLKPRQQSPDARLADHSQPQDAESVRSLGRQELARRLAPFQHRGQLLVKHFPTGALTLGMLVSYLDMLERVENFKPDIVLLDYLTLMHIDTRDFRISVGEITRNLRGLAAMREFALVTVVQAQRGARGAQWVTSAHVAEDWSIVQTADTFITYSQTPHERKLNVARILVDKARNSMDKWPAVVIQAYDIGQFHLDSNFMTDVLWEQIREPSPPENQHDD